MRRPVFLRVEGFGREDVHTSSRPADLLFRINQRGERQIGGSGISTKCLQNKSVASFFAFLNKVPMCVHYASACAFLFMCIRLRVIGETIAWPGGSLPSTKDSRVPMNGHLLVSTNSLTTGSFCFFCIFVCL